MLANDKPLTVTARSVEPYLHLDNRGLVIFDGRHCVVFPGQTLGWVRETMQILRDEKRATRRHGDFVLGGFASDDESTVTLYGGPAEHMATLAVDFGTLGQLYEQLGGR
jgi:hypothetical protein